MKKILSVFIAVAMVFTTLSLFAFAKEEKSQKEYIKWAEKKVGKITYASWRNKFTGWHDSWAMSLDGENTETEKVDWHDSYNLLIKGKKGFYNSRLSQGDVFYNLFLGDYCCNPACAKDCKYKYDRSSADIRIGDLWGKTYTDNDKGVSALITFTQKGKEIVEQLKDVTLIEHPFEVVAEGQMKRNVHKASTYPIVMRFLKSGFGLDSKTWKVLHFTNRVCKKIQKTLNK